MFKIKNFEDNDDVKIVEELGAFKVLTKLNSLLICILCNLLPGIRVSLFRALLQVVYY